MGWWCCVPKVVLVGSESCGVCAEVVQEPAVRDAIAKGQVKTTGGSLPFTKLDAKDPAAQPILDHVKRVTGKRYVPALVVEGDGCRRVLNVDDLIAGKDLPANACEAP